MQTTVNQNNFQKTLAGNYTLSKKQNYFPLIATKYDLQQNKAIEF